MTSLTVMTALIILITTVFVVTSADDAKNQSTNYVQEWDDPLMLLSTLDGSVYGVGQKTGYVRWKLKDVVIKKWRALAKGSVDFMVPASIVLGTPAIYSQNKTNNAFCNFAKKMCSLISEPVVKVPVGSSQSFAPLFLPDPKDGSLYLLRGSDSEALKKLPFTIPQLVASSPCKSSDGILYTESRVGGRRPVGRSKSRWVEQIKEDVEKKVDRAREE
uniref:Uncharacterized protein n=1 Tax=Timema poppense TaxID=170557 RepID=A0A7R9D8G1_TIMPO|nr:unnamed protein product [Timema poppensis]